MRVNSCPAFHQTPETTSDSFIHLLKKTFDREPAWQFFLQAVAATSVAADKTVRAPNDRDSEEEEHKKEYSAAWEWTRRYPHSPSPMNILFKYIGLFAFLQKERYIFVFNLAVVSLGLPLPLRRPPWRNYCAPEVPLI